MSSVLCAGIMPALTWTGVPQVAFLLKQRGARE
jgi:hypothetical protein